MVWRGAVQPPSLPPIPVPMAASVRPPATISTSARQ